MPNWAGKWKGGRYYLDDDGKRVFLIEKMTGGKRYSIKLRTHDEELAKGELARFVNDPVAYFRVEEIAHKGPVDISSERINLYLESIRHTVKDHYTARDKYLHEWSGKMLNLRTADEAKLLRTLKEFGGGYRGRTEALNAFARFLVKKGHLDKWTPLVCTIDADPEMVRAERVAYSIKQLTETYRRLDGWMRDLFYLRAATGMHQTEIDQIEGAKIYDGPLPEKGVGIRKLGGKHAIQGVVQVMHKSRHRHRQSVDAKGLAAALRLREGVPNRVSVWKAFDPIIPSNLRHTFVTLAGEVGELVSYKSGGVERSRIAQAVGHRAGSTMTADRYDKLQVPEMIRLPLKW